VEPLDAQVAVVTGAASGIGRGIAAVLSREGAAVVLADIDADGAERAAAELRAEGRNARAVPVDVTDRASAGSMASAVAAELGRIDILAANAGIYPPTELDTVDDAAWDRIQNINVKGALHVIQACLPSMRAQGYGRIVLTSSITGPITGQPGYTGYGASKAAMLGMMRSAAVDLAGAGITINAVMPGNVHTPGYDELGQEHNRTMLAAIPIGRLADPEEIGWAVRFLASREAGYITGQTLVIDGGQTLPEGA
jgi:3-oxoacyl-[acyl-carrier protein] reductase